MRRLVKWLLVIALVVGGGYVLLRVREFRQARAAFRDAIQNTVTAVVERKNLDVVVTGKGTVQTKDKRYIRPGVSGTVAKVFVKEGDLVRAGSPLLILENETLTTQVEQARLDLALAEQALANMTGPAGTRAKAELALRQAELDLRSAKEKLDALTVRVPISGDLWRLYVEEGDSVRAGQILATVADTSSFSVDARVRQADLRKLTVGHSVTIQPGGDMKPVYGKIESIGSEGLQGAKGIEFPVKVSIDNPGPDLRAGMSVQVDCHLRNGSKVSMTGTVVPKDRRDIEAEVAGTVKEVRLAEGAVVQAGDVLLIIEQGSLEIAYEQALNAYESAKQSLESCERQIEEQHLRVEQARLNVKDRENAAGKLVVTSPIDGKVISLSVEPGDEVSASEVVAEVVSVSPLTVVIPVDELDVAAIAIGQRAAVEIDALPGKVFEGVVSRIAHEGKVQQGITNYDVTIEIEAEEVRLGMSAKATISVSSKEDVLVVPVEAVFWENNQAYVTKLEDGRAVKTRVKVGVQNDLYAEIASGLEEGDEIVVSGLTDYSVNLRGFRMFGPR
ncbi:MAG TPA: efflux RND transporter periplasmic adaptor subunit [Firmicutes bacterium]|nr:efflux RND transporter periplasmic adaptor subunit [Candidatus Fermentithermobacillaceae bacterium]